MAAPMRVLPRLPVLVILGATGTGKSKLALELGSRFNGEIISADSMQVYKGLDIITNKVPAAERQQCPHHMIDYVDPLGRYTVVDFRNKAVPIVDDILSRQKLPIIVGGTNYYIESLLWNILLEMPIRDSGELILNKELHRKGEPSLTPGKRSWNDDIAGSALKVKMQKTEGDVGDSNVKIEEKDHEEKDETKKGVMKSELENKREELRQFISNIELDKVSGTELRCKLEAIDPVMADGTHPNDKRKLFRSLQVFVDYGVIHSELLEKQRSTEGGSVLGGPLRYKDACILWLQCERSVLDERLNKRVDEMMDAGLLDELNDFHSNYNQERLKSHKPESQSQHSCFLDIFSGPGKEVPPVYGLDVTNVTDWDTKVLAPAVQILQSLSQGQTPSISPLPREATPDIDHHVSNVCEVCDGKLFVGEKQWKAHLQSRRHEKKMKKKRQLDKMEECYQATKDQTAKSS
ncbi:tRNA dimethylallyltransferase-like [Saccoglossus kowalevskii]